MAFNKPKKPNKTRHLKVQSKNLKLQSQDLNFDNGFSVKNIVAGLPQKQAGFNMVEVMLVLAASAAVTVTAYGIYKSATAATKVEKTETQLRSFIENVLNSQAGSSDFSRLSNEALIADHLIPNGMKISDDKIFSEWGKEIRVIPTDVVRNGNTISNAGFAIIFDNVEAGNCVKLASNTGGLFTNINIEGEDVGIGRSLDTTAVTSLCQRASGATMQFVYEAAAEIASSGSLTLCEEIRPLDQEVQHIACSAGFFGIVTQTRSAFCTSPYDPFQWSGWTTTSDTCAACPAPENRVNSQTLTCPTGQLGEWVQKRNENRTANCPIAGPVGPTENWEWRSWTATSSWVDSINTCAPICVLPNPSSENRWVSENHNCPTGQFGHNNWERQDGRASSCPAPTGDYTWSAWTATGTIRNTDNTCATCPAAETKTESCPSGSVGEIVSSRSFKCSGEGGWNPWVVTKNTCATCPSNETQTLQCTDGTFGTIVQNRSYNCQGVTGGWNPWVTSTNTCRVCPAPVFQTEEQTVNYSSYDCPAQSYGQNGYSQDQVRSRTGTFNCPAGTTVLSPPSYTTWTAWTNDGAAVKVSTSCANCPVPATETNKQWVAFSDNTCPVNTYGSINREREESQTRTKSYVCPVGTAVLPAPSYTAWSAWTNTGTTRQVSTACTNCPASENEYNYKWTGITEMCLAGQFGVTTYEKQEVQGRTKFYVCPAGTASLPAPNYGTWTAWANAGPVRNWATTCSNCPGPSTETNKQWIAFSDNTCPANTYGSINREREQSQTRTKSYVCPAGTASLPAPSYTAWSAWTNTGVTRQISTACTNCPTAVVETNKQWVAFSDSTCPANTYGSINREREQSQTRTKSYVCLVGTAALPAPSYTAWSAWTNTGVTRQTSTACTNCPADALNYGSQWVNYTSNSCPSGQYGYTNRQKEQLRNQWITYNCPAGTSSLPAPSYGAWSAWWDTGNNQHVSNVCYNCPGAGTDRETTWGAVNLNRCPAGAYGYHVINRESARTRTYSYNCPAGTASIPAPSYSGWTGWSLTGAEQYLGGDCPSCPGGGTNRETTWGAVNLNRCPAGAYGYHVINRESARTRTYSYNCPAGTASIPAPSYSGWTGWALTGAEQYLGGDCPSCPGAWNNTNYQWVNVTAGCPAGQNGSITYQKQQIRYQYVSYNCPAGTASIPAPSYGGWGGWSDTGATQSYNSSCAPACTPTSTQEWGVDSTACPSGQYASYQGSAYRTKTVNCPAGNITYSAWTVSDPRQCCRNGWQCQIN